MTPASTDKKYVPRLQVLQPQHSLPDFLGRFYDSMIAAHIPPQQWVVPLQDILTGLVLRTFQDLSDDDKSSFTTTGDKLLATQNLTAEHYRLQFGKVEPAPEQSFSDFISCVKTIFDRWLQLSHVSTYQQLYDLMIKNKVYQSCNVSLIVFLQKRDPTTLNELTKLGDFYYTAYPNSQVHKDVPFQIFACEATSEVSDEEIDAYAAQTL